MAINPSALYPDNTTNPSVNYPYGGARDVSIPGDDSGSPWAAAVLNDIWGFNQSILSRGGITPSGTPDNVSDSDYMDALSNIFNVKVNNVAELVALENVNIGDKIETLGYTTSGDSGGNLYEAVAAGTGTDDGGSFINCAGTPAIQWKGLFSRVIYVQQFGAKGNGVDDDTTQIQAALTYVSLSTIRLQLYLPSGIYLLTDSLVVRNPAAAVPAGGWSIRGDGFNSVLYQTGAGKDTLVIGTYLPSPGLPVEGLTLDNFSIVGTNGTNYGLYLNEVARCNFSNLWIMADTADLALKGCLINSWTGIKLGYAAFNENPISGITIPTTRQYGLYTEPGSLNSYTTNCWNGLVCEGHSVGGIFVEGGSTNTYNNLVCEGELGYGILSSAEWDVFNGLYVEAITGIALELRNTQKCSLISIFTNTESIYLNNATATVINSRADWILGLTPGGVTFINSDGTVTYNASASGEDCRFIGCGGLEDLTHGITYGQALALTGGSTGSFSAVPPRALKDEIHYGVTSPSSGRWSWGDKVWFSEGNGAGNRGSRVGGYLGAVCSNRTDTTITADYLASATNILVSSTSGISPGDIIGIQNNVDGSLFYTDVVSLGGGPDITVSDPIPNGGLIGYEVITYRFDLFGLTTGFQTLGFVATPNVSGGSKFLTPDPGATFTDFVGGVVGQEILICADQATTITNGVNMFLSGSVDYVMSDGDTLTLIQKPDGKWYETSRSAL